MALLGIVFPYSYDFFNRLGVFATLCAANTPISGIFPLSVGKGPPTCLGTCLDKRQVQERQLSTTLRPVGLAIYDLRSQTVGRQVDRSQTERQP